jgi:hypothetical protein
MINFWMTKLMVTKMLDPRDIGAVAPAGASLLASWLGLVETGLSIVLIVASLAFLVWRWRLAVKHNNGDSE